MNTTESRREFEEFKQCMLDKYVSNSKSEGQVLSMIESSTGKFAFEVWQAARERQDRELSHCLWLISQIYSDLPTNRDWLNPEYESLMKVVYEDQEAERKLNLSSPKTRPPASDKI